MIKQFNLRQLNQLPSLFFWLFFFLLPVVHTIHFVDNFIVIKWIILYIATLLLSIQLWKIKPVQIPKSPLIFIGLTLFFHRVFFLFLDHPISIEWFSLFDTLIFTTLLGTFTLLKQPLDTSLNLIRAPFLFGLIFVLARSLVHFIQSRFLDSYFGPEAFASSFGNINLLSEYLILSLPLLIHYTLQIKNPPAHRRLEYTVFGLSLFFLYWGHSRSAWFAFLILFFYYSWKKMWRRSHWLIMSGLVVVNVVLHLFWSHGELTKIDMGKVASNTARKSLIQSSLSLISEKPLGIGSEQFEFFIAPYRILTEDPQMERVLDRTPHNELLRWTIEYGWAYGLIILLFIGYLLKLLIKSKSPLFLSLFLVYLPQILFQFPFLNAFGFGFAAIFLGLFLANHPFVFFSWSLKPPLFRLISVIVFTISFISSVLFSWSKYEEVHAALNLERSHFACEIYPINWRSCINVVQHFFNQKNSVQSLQLAKSELKRHPFNLLAIKFAIMNQLQVGNQNLACEGADLYETLLADKGAFSHFVNKVCKQPRRFKPLTGSNLEKQYQEWLQKTKLFVTPE